MYHVAPLASQDLSTSYTDAVSECMFDCLSTHSSNDALDTSAPSGTDDRSNWNREANTSGGRIPSSKFAPKLEVGYHWLM